MRFFISVDMEGIAGVVNLTQVVYMGYDYNRFREIMTKEVLTVVNTLKKLGAKKIVIADAHGYMTNILIEELPREIELISGFPRPSSMVCCIWDGFDAAIFLGYHTKPTSKDGVISHVMYRGFRRIMLNGKELSEFHINAYFAGEYNVPVILVSGDSKTCEEAKIISPEIETVITKTPIGRWAARNFSIQSVIEKLTFSTRKAVEKMKEGKIKPLKIKEQSELVFELQSSDLADIAELVPGAKRLSPTEVAFEINNFIEAYKIIDLITMAGLGLEYLINKMR